MSLGFNVIFCDGYYYVIDLTDGSLLGSFASVSDANRFIYNILLDAEDV